MAINGTFTVTGGTGGTGGSDEFAGRDLEIAAGVIRGVRSFQLDRWARLRGVSYDQIWTPGENTAVCKRELRYDADYAVASFARSAFGVYGNPTAADMERAYRQMVSQGIALTRAKQVHEMSTCSCGFYAYYDGSNDYAAPGRITGIVEGYGEVLIGSRGFRAAKARIVALWAPTEPDATPATYTAPAQVVLPPGVGRRVRRNYVDVPAFASYAAMVAEFPPDDSYLPDPSTESDFWTRD